jgi:hypothetical protein
MADKADSIERFYDYRISEVYKADADSVFKRIDAPFGKIYNCLLNNQPCLAREIKLTKAKSYVIEEILNILEIFRKTEIRKLQKIIGYGLNEREHNFYLFFQNQLTLFDCLHNSESLSLRS